jgi:hypothetical protein
VVHDGELDASTRELPGGPILNIGRALANVDVRVLDAITVHANRGSTSSRAEKGLPLVGNTLCSRRQTDQQTDLLSKDDAAGVVKKQEREEAARKAEEGASRAPSGAGKKATADQGDLFNPQGGLFRRGDGEGDWTEARISMVRQAVEQYARGWKVKPPIHVIATMLDAPAEVLRELGVQNSQGASGDIDGFYWRGGVYLVGANLRDAEHARRVLYHEALGHHGLRAVFGDQLVPILRQLAAMRPQLIARKAKQYGLNLADEGDRLMAAEEVLAELAQERPELGWVQRTIAAIRRWLRAHGVTLGLTDGDIIANYILPARGFVERGRAASVTVATSTAFSRRGAPETPEFKRWFGDSKVVDADGNPLVVYHGTSRDVSNFGNGKTQTADDAPRAGFYFTEDTRYAGLFASKNGGNIMPVYLSVKNPVDLREGVSADLYRAIKGAGYERAQELLTKTPEDYWELLDGDRSLIDALESLGHDGLRIKEPEAFKSYPEAWIAFRTEQIKSAIGNRGTFDPNDARV